MCNVGLREREGVERVLKRDGGRKMGGGGGGQIVTFLSLSFLLHCSM